MVWNERIADELPTCIWVQAGVLSYRLCDRAYDCEGCELFRALRSGGSEARQLEDTTVATRDPTESEVGVFISQLVAGCKLHFDRHYSPSHFWLAPDNGAVTVGIEGQILRVLHPVDDVVIPGIGVRLERGEPCGWIRHRHRSTPLYAPVTGEVVERNGDYLGALRTEGDAVDGDPWLLRIAVHERLESVPDLFHGEDALRWYLQGIQLIKRSLREVLGATPHREVGPTLEDGGRPASDLEHVLGPRRYEALVRSLFRRQI